MLRRVPSLAVFAGALLFAAGCQDMSTTPSAVPPEQSARSVQPGAPDWLSAGHSASPYACFTSVATPGGPWAYRYGHLELQFPAAALAGGRTLRYRYRAYSSDGVDFPRGNGHGVAQPSS